MCSAAHVLYARLGCMYAMTLPPSQPRTHSAFAPGETDTYMCVQAVELVAENKQSVAQQTGKRQLSDLSPWFQAFTDQGGALQLHVRRLQPAGLLRSQCVSICDHWA